jgi:hypothetical protein
VITRDLNAWSRNKCRLCRASAFSIGWADRLALCFHVLKN